MKKLKNKILFGLVFLLVVIFLLSITGIFSIYYLSADSKAIMKDNYTSVEYSIYMLDAIESIYANQISLLDVIKQNKPNVNGFQDSLLRKRNEFEEYLNKQKKNITEPGEDEVVNNVTISYTNFIAVVDSSYNPNYINDTDVIDRLKSNYIIAASSIEEIYKINMAAIYKKNRIANQTADNVSLYMAIAAITSILITVIFIFYFPSYIASPIAELTKKIEDISNKKYDQKISIHSNDELKTLAIAFNKMSVKLKEYQAQHLDELLMEKHRMETLLTNLQDGILLLDNEFNILHVNHKFCELTEMRITDLIGRSITQLGSDNQFLININSIDIKNLKKQPQEKIKSFSSTINGQVEYFQIFFLDISRANRKEAKSDPSGYILLIRNITKYEERDLAKTNLIATISHELKTPLSSINLSLKLLEDERIGNLNDEQKGLTTSLKQQSNRILSLVNEVLDYTQAETGQIKLKINPCEVKDIIELSTFAVLMFINEKEIELDLTIPHNTPRVKCDIEKTVWVLVNLLSNAIRYSPTKSKIYIQINALNEFVVFSVKDEGQGIDEEEQKIIFDKYVKSNSSKARGTGLGLAIAKEFVEVQGGTIKVESIKGKGSRFYFTLPRV